MKNLKQSLFWTIIINFILWNISSSLQAAICNYTEGESKIKEAEACEDKPAMNWNCESNLCEYDEKKLVTNEEVLSCRQDCHDDYKDDKGKIEDCTQSCFEHQAEDETRRKICEKDHRGDEEIKDCMDNLNLEQAGFLTKDFKEEAYHYSMFAVHGLSLILSVFLVLLQKSSPCPVKSALVMVLAAGVALAGEVGTFVYISVKSKQIKKKYDSINIKDSSIDLQKNAFQGLAEMHKLRGDTELVRAIIYYAVAALYIIAVLVAAYEIISTGIGTTCANNAAPISASSAGGGAIGSLISGAISVLPSGATNSAIKLLRKLIGNPVVRIVLSSLLGGLSIVLGTHSVIAAKESYRRVKLIKKVLRELQQHWINSMCDDKERKNPDNQQCYCYTGEGKRNLMERSNSDVCNAAWEEDDVINVPDPTNYNFSSNSPNGPTGCVNVKDEFDEECICKKIKGKNGENACKKSNLTVQLGSIPAINDLNSAESITDDILSGTLTQGNFHSPLSSYRQAAKLNKIAQRELSNVKKHLLKSGSQKDALKKMAPAELLKGFMTALNPDDLEKVGNFSANQSNSDFSAFQDLLSDKQKELLKKADKQDSNLFYTGGGSAKTKNKENKKDPFSLSSFMGGNEGNQSSGNKILNVPESEAKLDYQYKDNDLHLKKDKIIWNIISNRYQTTGMQRLFTTEKTQQMDQ